MESIIINLLKRTVLTDGLTGISLVDSWNELYLYVNDYILFICQCSRIHQYLCHMFLLSGNGNSQQAHKRSLQYGYLCYYLGQTVLSVDLRVIQHFMLAQVHDDNRFQGKHLGSLTMGYLGIPLFPCSFFVIAYTYLMTGSHRYPAVSMLNQPLDSLVNRMY